MKMGQRFVAVLMGSDSDLAVLQSTFDVLDALGVDFECKITSAHRTPAATHAYVKDADERGCAVFMLALSDPDLAQRIATEREQNAAVIAQKDADLQASRAGM
jgi:phosphoribosylcarboxyaminoimidazole (NCAIR) mutase